MLLVVVLVVLALAAGTLAMLRPFGGKGASAGAQTSGSGQSGGQQSGAQPAAQPSATGSPIVNPTHSPTPKPSHKVATVTGGGDVIGGFGVSSVVGSIGSSLFKSIASYFESSDYGFVNLESPLTTGGDPQGWKDVVIKGSVGEGGTVHELRIPLVVDGKHLGWIEINYSLENIRGELDNHFRRRLFTLVGTWAFGLILVLLVARGVASPLEELSRAAARVAEGGLDVTVPVERDDEIGQLATSFNRMTERLRERQELEARLSAAEKRAEIGHLASGLAHEIKNPLNALSLGLDVLRRRHRPEGEAASAEYTSRIAALREEIDRLAALINNFLAYGRPLSLSRTPVDLEGIVRVTVSDLSETAEQVGVRLEAAVEPGLPRADVDGSLVKSAIWNLVQNAVQAMERSGGLVQTSLRREPGDGPPRAEVLVEDDGPGIAPADLPHLFEPYFSRKDGGVGLGLAMVRRIAEEHGGSASAENREEGGARFRISFPLLPG